MFMYGIVVILYAAERQISVVHRQYSVFCHRRAGLYGRTSPEGIAGLKDLARGLGGQYIS